MLTKRDLLKQSLFASAFATAGTLASASQAKAAADTRKANSAPPIVRTTYGRLRGRWADSIAVFKGISYGAPTGGSNRFMPPKEPWSWKGVRDAFDYGDSCPQPHFGTSPFTKPGEPTPPPNPLLKEFGEIFPKPSTHIPQSEDCLKLNVWTPAPDKAGRPVMVWLHGGGFAVGSGSAPMYDGTNLARKGDVVVVTLNHRLNTFGYLYLGEIGGKDFAPSGNVGMLDIVAALRWVRNNIENFGGDPNNVTIFGESGGAGKVSVMCAIPAAKGLFHKAIMQSGPCLDLPNRDKEAAMARQVLHELDIAPNNLKHLQQVDIQALLKAADAAQNKVAPRIFGIPPTALNPLVDNVVIHHEPFDPVAAPESAEVPFIVGSTLTEAVMFAIPMPRWGKFTIDEVKKLVRPLAGARTDAAVTFYQKLHPGDSPSYLLTDIVTDHWMRQAANRVGERKAKQGKAPVYLYVLGWEIDSKLRTPHGTDVPLVFDNVDKSPLLSRSPGSRTVSDQMSDAWIAFARTGNPNTAKVPHWPAYTLEKRANMLFNTKSRVVNDYGAQARRFWEEG